MLKMHTSSGACLSASPKKEMISSSLRASSERAWISPPAASISFTSGSSLAPLRRAGDTLETFGRKLLGDLAADKVTGADHGHGRVSLLQGCSPGQVKSVSYEAVAHFRVGQASCRDSASLCLRILPVEVAGRASSTL